MTLSHHWRLPLSTTVSLSLESRGIFRPCQCLHLKLFAYKTVTCLTLAALFLIDVSAWLLALFLQFDHVVWSCADCDWPSQLFLFYCELTTEELLRELSFIILSWSGTPPVFVASPDSSMVNITFLILDSASYNRSDDSVSLINF